jgi:hypothetical protein
MHAPGISQCDDDEIRCECSGNTTNTAGGSHDADTTTHTSIQLAQYTPNYNDNESLEQIHINMPRRDQRNGATHLSLVGTGNGDNSHDTTLFQNEVSTSSYTDVPSRAMSNGVRRANNRFRTNVLVSRSSAIFLLVTVAYMLAYLPNCIARILSRAEIVVESTMSDGYHALFNFAEKCFFINNVLNPIIYGVLNPKFRHECLKALIGRRV